MVCSIDNDLSYLTKFVHLANEETVTFCFLKPSDL